MNKINTLLECRICDEKVLVKSNLGYYRICKCGNIQVDTVAKDIVILSYDDVRVNNGNRWVPLLMEEE